MTLRGMQKQLRNARDKLIQDILDLQSAGLPDKTSDLLFIGITKPQVVSISAHGSQFTVTCEEDSEFIAAAGKTAETLADEIIEAGVRLLESRIGDGPGRTHSDGKGGETGKP